MEIDELKIELKNKDAKINDYKKKNVKRKMKNSKKKPGNNQRKLRN